MDKIYFATSNKDKLRETGEILGINVQGTSVEIDEIQSLDPVKVATHKAIAYYKKLKKPIFVEDIALTFNALKKLPGTYIKDFLKALGNSGMASLLDGFHDRGAVAQTTIVFIDKKGKTHPFVGRIKGKIAQKPVGNKGFGWDPIFIPIGESKTFGQMTLEVKNKYSMRAKALKKFKKFLDKQ